MLCGTCASCIIIYLMYDAEAPQSVPGKPSAIPLPLLLPVLGAAAAVLASAISNPFANTLVHPGMPSEDPRFHFALGTFWATVHYFTFGAFLCGSFVLA